MNIKPYIYVYNIVKNGTIRETANQMFVTQPTISQQVKKLEKELGFKIFEKTGREIRLTSEGEKIYPFVKNLVDCVYKLDKEIEHIREKDNKLILLGIGPVISHSIITKIILAFKKKHPEVSISITESGSIELSKLVKNNDIDSAIVNTDKETRTWLEQNNVFHHSFFNTDFLLMTSSKHNLSNRKSISFKDIKNESLMLYKNGIVQKSLLQLLSSDEKQNIFLSFVDYTSIINLVRDNLGVSIVPKSLVNSWFKSRKEGVSFVEFNDFGKSMKVSYIYNVGDKNVEYIKYFQSILSSYVKKIGVQ